MSETPYVPNGASSDERAETHIDEAIARYYGEWALMKVAPYGPYHDPARGVVLAHSPNREAVSEVLANNPELHSPARHAAGHRYYTFLGRPHAHPGESIDEARARFERQRASVLAARR